MLRYLLLVLLGVGLTSGVAQAGPKGHGGGHKSGGHSHAGGSHSSRPHSSDARVHVHGYTKKNGTHVAPYTRRYPQPKSH
jgi:hypothetical protein